ncbi:hypothetical protein [Kangiella shandongensis]|uniref:hypothetical protein n=1 Tax=Kangiella shandongensis TaxID=2763258 RepID=UPI001CC1286F|nr:hypothetical protein [Kangiella shandongensis]
MNKLLVPLLVASVVGNAYLLFDHSGQPQKPEVKQSEGQSAVAEVVEIKPADNHSETDTIIQDLNEKLLQSRSLVESLKKKNQELESKIASLEEDRTTVDNSPEEVASNDKPKKSKGEKTVEELKEDQNRRIALFENEAVNQEWAYPTQDDLNDVISDSELLARMSVNEVTCKTSSCRVSVTPLQEGVGARIGAYFEFSQMLREDEQFKDYLSSSHHDDESNNVYIYIERPDSEG